VWLKCGRLRRFCGDLVVRKMWLWRNGEFEGLGLEGGLAGGLHPTLRKGAKDGAPGLLWLAGFGRRTWLVDGLHPTLRRVREGWGTRAFVAGWVWKAGLGWLMVYIPPFAEVREGWGTRAFVGG
jgi:hypothetical protein